MNSALYKLRQLNGWSNGWTKRSTPYKKKFEVFFHDLILYSVLSSIILSKTFLFFSYSWNL